MRLGILTFVMCLLLCVSVVTAEDGFAPAPDQVSPLLVGHKLPALKLTSEKGTLFDLAEQNKTKPLVVVFYRGHW